jgi:alginate O-acetyltransferase complex protein AlgI
MLFTSVTFLFYFLPLVLSGYFLLRSIPARNQLLLFSSLLFYAWGEPIFVLVMLISIGMNFVAGRRIDTADGAKRKWTLGLAIGANLLILTIFKYAGFLVEICNLMLVGFGQKLPVPEIPLPLGISFFTFQAISYLVDVHRKHVPAETNPLDLGMYIAMFPQLVAGPIVRFETVAKQIHQRRSTLGRASIGARIFIVGLAQKTLIANEVAVIADAGFAVAQPSLAEAWLALVAYTTQIYFDFAGYSNMAIGLGLIFGFTFPRNFRVPYGSLSVTEFWRRWHISLSSWFRDYLYIPLGGNRYSTLRTYTNLVIVFLLCGLWHGASWTFLIWGAHHGALLVLERVWLSKRLKTMHSVAANFYTLTAVMLGWVWFRAEDFGRASAFFKSLFGLGATTEFSAGMNMALYPTSVLALLVGLVFALHPGPTRGVRSTIALWVGGRRQAVVATVDVIGVSALLLLCAMAIGKGAYNPFLYFRF